jgi:hypothetical protein
MMPADDIAKLFRERRKTARSALLSAAVANVSMFIEKAIDSRLRSNPKQVMSMDREVLLQIRAVRDRALGGLQASIKEVLDHTLRVQGRRKMRDPDGDAVECVVAIADLAEARAKSILKEIDLLTQMQSFPYELDTFRNTEPFKWQWDKLAALGRAEQDPTGIDLRLYLPEAVPPAATRPARARDRVVRRP